MSDSTPNNGLRDTSNLGTIAGNREAQPNFSAATLTSILDSVRPATTAPGTEEVGRYRLGDEIARGGMGIVHAARDLVLDRDIVLKTFQQLPPDDPFLVLKSRLHR
jgi:hypothetical protein